VVHDAAQFPKRNFPVESGDAGFEWTAVRLDAADERDEWQLRCNDFPFDADGKCAESSAADIASKKTIRGRAVPASDTWKFVGHVVCGRNVGIGNRVCDHTIGRDRGHAVVQSGGRSIADWRRDSGEGWDAVWNRVGRWDRPAGETANGTVYTIKGLPAKQ